MLSILLISFFNNPIVTDAVTVEELENEHIILLNDELSSNYFIKLDRVNKVFSIVAPTNLSRELEYINRVSNIEDGWEGLKNEIISFSKTISKNFNDDYSIRMVSGIDTGLVLYEVKNGEVMNNYASDLIEKTLHENANNDSTIQYSGNNNALQKAEEYFRYNNFSKLGIKGQLEYEGYTPEEIEFCLDNLKVNWNEQAFEKAKSYLKYNSFSKQALYDQLLYEGFTEEQSQYAVDKIFN